MVREAGFGFRRVNQHRHVGLCCAPFHSTEKHLLHSNIPLQVQLANCGHSSNYAGLLLSYSAAPSASGGNECIIDIVLMEWFAEMAEIF